MVNRSIEMKNPNTPVASTMREMKNSLGRSSIFQEMKTPASTTMEASTIMATEIPSTPMA